MSRYNHNKNFTVRGLMNRALATVASIVILLFFLPRGERPMLDMKLGKPWNYGTVIAKENFPILKPDSLLKAERDSLMQQYKPIYEKDPEMGNTQVAAFLNTFDNTLAATTPQNYRKYLSKKLQKIYETGVVPAEEYERLKKEGSTGIIVSEQNMGNARELEELYTPKTAYEYLCTVEDSAKQKRNIIQHCDLNRFIKPNLTYDSERSEAQRENVEKQLVRYSGQMLAGQKIIDHGDIVDERKMTILHSMEVYRQGAERSPAERFSMLGGQAIYVSVIVLCLLVFFNQFRSDYLQRARTVMLILLLTILFPLLTYTLVRYSLVSVYVIPYCILPIYIRVFLDSRTAFITHLASVLLSALALNSPFEFVVIQVVAGLTAIYSLKDLSQRSELFGCAILVTVASWLCLLCFDLLHMSVFTDESFDYSTYLFILLGGFLLLISYLLLIPFERLFKFTSSVTLVELSNTNNEVLRRLSEEAPGTFQHSMQVANLAAEVANALGAKSQLVRTGAMYHDIGKLEAPVFFTENQNGKNPHDNLSYVKSAQIIISHVKKGLELADKYKLPDTIREFIATHHGKSKAKYFYVKYKNENPQLEVDESFFTYPGPNPSTLEQAILMMADSVEAASRSLPEYTEESVSTLIDRIVDSQVQEGYFNLCPITFQDITHAKQVMKEKLMTIYHTRIQYPEMENK